MRASRPVRALVTVGAVGMTVLSLAGAAGAAQALPNPGPPSGTNGWTVYHGDPLGTGVASGPGPIDTSTPVWTSPVLDGQLYGQPLEFDGRVFVATENDTVVALDDATGQVVWSRHLGTPVPATALPCGDIQPVEGITGTPVIDPARAEIFVVADEFVHGTSTHVLVGLGTTSGTVEFAQNVDPPGSDTAALLQRTGLTLDDGQVVFGFGGNYGDCSVYHGWVEAVAETGGTPVRFELDSGPGERQGAVWMGGA
ncbi:MAG TPA: PQQ-binding-like beta-propeller repeat protein, partial [Acidimicrobiales bacterium]|nr:PQQ-binding-like beta-propeller repeat protein [Acidimicrobiales bacterium]